MAYVERDDGVFIEVDASGKELREFNPAIIALIDDTTNEIQALTHLRFSPAFHVQGLPCYADHEGWSEVNLTHLLGNKLAQGRLIGAQGPYNGLTLDDILSGFQCGTDGILSSRG